MKLVNHTAIAEYIAAREGRACSPRTVRRYIARARHALPVRTSGRVQIAESSQVDAWLDGEARRLERKARRCLQRIALILFLVHLTGFFWCCERYKT